MFGQLFSKKQQVVKKVVKHSTLVFIDRDKCTLISYPDNLVHLYSYPATAVLDGDVIDREGLRDSFTKWLQENGIKSGEVTYVVTPSISFERLITPEEKQKTSETDLINSFIDAVPFQKVITARIMIGGNSAIIVTNKDLLNSITFSFESIGFHNVAVFPYKVLGDKTIPSTGNPLNDLIELGKVFLEMDEQKNRQALEFGVGTPKASSSTVTQISVSDVAQQEVNPMIAVVIVLFFVLIGGGVMYWRFDQVAKLQKDTATKLNKGRLVNTSALPKVAPEDANKTPTATTPSPADTKTNQKTKIEILYTPETEALYQKIKKELDKDSTLEVVGKSTSEQVPTNSVIFSDKAPTSLQAKLSEVFKTLSIQVELKNGKASDADAVIQLTSLAPSTGNTTPTVAPTSAPSLTPSPTP